ncbi:hypothetical protein SGPA1_10500 [Streptomyces misionensis JCM 4497]
MSGAGLVRRCGQRTRPRALLSNSVRVIPEDLRGGLPNAKVKTYEFRTNHHVAESRREPAAHTEHDRGNREFSTGGGCARPHSARCKLSHSQAGSGPARPGIRQDQGPAGTQRRR